MVGLPEQESRQSAIEKESANKGDIVQGAFVDTYSNLTYKHIMALRWATRYCPSAKFVVKIDDDVYVDVWRLADEIDRRFGLSVGTQHLICCGHVFANNTVYRDPQSKYYVTRSEWPRDGAYPPFCAGAAILYSSDVVAKMDAESQTTPYFRLDDVYVTAVLRQRLGLNMKVFEGKLEWRPNVVRRYIDAKTKPDFLFALTAEPTQILLLWQLRQSGAVSKDGGR
ncbi:PREDICTED: beta-1,3-galactosyltransferase 5-like [Priapulus caudatus]|uniref:Hexosyltransferase n=1 Tax=Priapulus caudatus TaxID=37621 RepID=A0ABM1E0X2_PRICU|nr:PREDICTED: beta-1,3-galactosyltransferase 5-like [Priapulus caudatus]